MYLSSVPGREDVRYDPRQEPGAVAPHAGIRGGGAGQPASLLRPFVFSPGRKPWDQRKLGAEPRRGDRAVRGFTITPCGVQEPC